MSARPYNRYNINFDDTELIKRSKRTRNLLIVVIVLLVLGLGALVYFGITLYNAARTTDNASLIPPYEIGNGKLDDIGVPQAVEFKKTTIPNLSALFGLNIDQVTSSLGSGFKLVKYENSQDSSNPNIVQMAVFSFTPELAEGIDISNTVVLMPTQSVYASFDGNGRVIDIYYVCDLRLLDYPVCTFEELLANDRLLLTALLAFNGSSVCRCYPSRIQLCGSRPAGINLLRQSKLRKPQNQKTIPYFQWKNSFSELTNRLDFNRCL